MKDIRLLTLLSLDSIYRVLEWEERVRIHLYLKGKIKALTPNIEGWEFWLEKSRWEAPEVLYKQDRLLYYYHEDSEEWRPIEQYLIDNETLTKEINQLKSKYNGNQRNN